MKQEYDFKVSTKKLSRCLLYLSLLLDFGMLIQALIAINMVINASVPPCDEWESRTLVSIISFLTIARVSHLIFMAIFFLFCFPCYFCDDDCCLKKWLVSEGGVSKTLMASLEVAWSWTYTPGGTIRINKDPTQNDIVYTGGTTGKDLKAMYDPTHCPACFLQFERGQIVTYLPCQLNRITALAASTTLGFSNQYGRHPSFLKS